MMQAGNRQGMLATDSISNNRGGVIAGREINATALTGDIINKRTVTTLKPEDDGYQLRNDVVSDASCFEVADIINFSTGRDITEHR